MKSILYLTRKTIKNLLLDLIHHPTKLIAYLVLILLVGSGIISTFSHDGNEALSEIAVDIGALHGAYLGILFIIGIPVVLYGLSSGTTLFQMSDVNFLFVSPISPKKNLVYGITKKMGATLLFFVCFLVYGNMARSLFDITVFDGVMLVLGIAVFIMASQLLTLVFYSFSNGRPKVVLGIKAALFACVGAAAVIVFVSLYTGGLSMENIMATLKNPALEYIPFFGWTKGLVFAIIENNSINIALFGGLFAVLLVVAGVLFAKNNLDFYEDVLQNTESTYEMREAAKQGKMVQQNNMFNRKVKVTDTGINNGWGANTFMFKHIREIKRRSRVLFVDMYTVITVAIALVMAFLMGQESGEDSISNGGILAAILSMSIYMQFFFSIVGEWNRELLKPYIYLVPQSPFKKLLWASATSLIKPFVDGAILFIVTGIYLQRPILQIIMCTLAYGSFGLMYCAVNIFAERFIGGINNKMITLTIYIIVLGISCLPGAAVSILLMVMNESISGVIVLIPMVVWNFIAATTIYLINKETLHNLEVST